MTFKHQYVGWFLTLVFASIFMTTPVSAKSETCQIETSSNLTPGQWSRVIKAPFEASDPTAYLWVLIDIGSEPIVVPAYSDGRGAFQFMVPADFNNPWVAKPIVEFWLSDGEVGCSIDGLTLGAMVEDRRALIDQIALFIGQARFLAIEMGYPPAMVKRVAEEGEMPAPHHPALMNIRKSMDLFQEIILLKQSAQSDGQLAHLLDVWSAYVGMSLANSDLQAQTTLWDEMYDSALAEISNRNSRNIQQLQSQPTYETTFIKELTRLPETNWSEPKTAEELSRRMRAQFSAKISTGPKASFFKDTAGTVLGAGGAGLSLFGPAGEKVSFAYARWADFMFMQAFSDKLVAGLYPGKFTAIKLVGGPFTLSTEGVRSAGSVTKILVTTEAEGLNMAKLMAELAANFTPFSGAVKGAAKGLAKPIARSVSKISPKAGSAMLKAFSSQSFKERAGLSAAVLDAAEAFGKQALSGAIGNAEDKTFVPGALIPPFKFAPVNILEAGYYDARPRDRSIISWDPSSRIIRYGANKEGRTFVDYQPHLGKWGKNSISGAQLIKVGESELSIIPEIGSVIPGEPRAFDILHTIVDVDPEVADLNVRFNSPGFKVSDIIGPKLTKTSDEQTARFTMIVETPTDTGLYPARVDVSLDSRPSVRGGSEIHAGTLRPERDCIGFGETEHFYYADYYDQPMAGVDWKLEGLGTLSEGGVFTAPQTGSGAIDIIAFSRRNKVEIGRKTIQLGCSCSWRFTMKGETLTGDSLSASTLDFGPVSNFTMIGIGESGGPVAMTGEGGLLSPKYVALTYQTEEDTYLSGLPVNLNLGAVLNSGSCQDMDTSIHQWSLEGRRWLKGRVIGRMATEREIGSGCVKAAHSFSFQFLLDLGANLDVSQQVIDELAAGNIEVGSPQSQELAKAVARNGLKNSICLPN